MRGMGSPNIYIYMYIYIHKKYIENLLDGVIDGGTGKELISLRDSRRGTSRLRGWESSRLVDLHRV